jgi:protein tyrosine phosphatase
MLCENKNVFMIAALVLRPEKKWNRYWTKEQYKDHNTTMYTLENVIRDVRMCQRNEKNIYILRLDDRSLDEVLTTATPTALKK